MVNIPYAQRFRTLVGDNVPTDVFGVLVDTDEGGDIIFPRTVRCEDCGERGPVGYWCSSCQDGSLYEETSDASSTETHISLGKCSNCTKVGPIGYSCNEQACAKSHAVFTRQGVMFNVSDKSSPSTSQASHSSSTITSYNSVHYSWRPELCHPVMSIKHHFLYTVELTVLLCYSIISMVILETTDVILYKGRTIMTFRQQYIYNCMWLSQIGLSWLYLWGHIMEILLFTILFDFLWDIFPLVEQGRIMVFEFLFQRPFDGIVDPQAEKPDYRLINKFLGPSIPLRTHAHGEVFADGTSVSMQTAYSIMGANWKYLGEGRLKYWATILKDNTVFATTDEPMSSRHFYHDKRTFKVKKKKPHPRSKAGQKEQTRLQKLIYKSYVQVTQTEAGNVGSTRRTASCLIAENKSVEGLNALFNRTKNNNVVSSMELLWDTGATMAVTPYLNDFTSELITTNQPKVMKGIATGLSIQGVGTVEYMLKDDNGFDYIVKTQAYYAPQATRRIFSPQAFFQDVGCNATATQNTDHIILSVGKHNFTMYYNASNNLPTMHIAKYGRKCIDDNNISTPEASPCIIEETNTNLTKSQKLLLQYHFRLGHINMAYIQLALRSGYLGDSLMIKQASKCEIPMCPTCKFAKAKRRSTGYKATTLPLYPSSIDNDVLCPGQKVSMDHFKVTEKGRLFESQGKTPANLMYSGDCIFIDHATKYISIKLQVHLDAQETIAAKMSFEREMFQYGILIETYHTDNGIFSSKDFVNQIEESLQNIRYSGVGGQHQNRAAERTIGTAFDIARAMLIQFAIRWPEVFQVNVWPMAAQYAKWLVNHVPKANGIAAYELVVRSKTARHVLKNAHVFGCPVYVLDPKLQSLGNLPKFQARSKRGVFMGFSERHSSLVPLVLNLVTLSITPQYHVIFDDWFQTVDSSLTPEEFECAWDNFFDINRYHYEFDPEEIVVYNDDWNSQLQPVYCKHYDQTSSVSEGATHPSVVPEGEQAVDAAAKETTSTAVDAAAATSTNSAATTSHNNTTTSHNNTMTLHNNDSTTLHNNNTTTSHNNDSTTLHNNNSTTLHNSNNIIPAPHTPMAISLIHPEPYGISSHPNYNNNNNNNNNQATIMSNHYDQRSSPIILPSTNNNNYNRTAPTPRAIRYDPPPPQQQETTVERVEPRRSTRTRQPIERLIYNACLNINRHQLLIEASDVAQAYRQANVNEDYIAAFTAQIDEYDGNLDYVDPGVFLYLSQRARVNVSRTQTVPSSPADLLTRAPPIYTTPSVFVSDVDNDTFRYHEALMQPDWEDFQKAAVLEITTLEQMGTWDEVQRSSVPANKKVLGGTWVFRRKRNPEGKIVKYKARYCVRGDQQVAGVDYFDSYAPVTMWYTIRMMFILSIIFGWHSCQVDYANAFAQAYLKELVYIEIPRGFSGNKANMVLRLMKSLYGLVQAPKTFYDLLTTQLTRCGYVSQPNIDPCLWINKKRKIICVIWVDDCLFFCKDKDQIKQSIDELKKNMPLTMEDSVTAFLGIKVERNSSGCKLSQPGLIAKIVEASDLKECNAVRTPAATSPIGADPTGERHNEKWEYNSVVGMLMFLANNTRPDIAYAVHQCARFLHSPKASHSLAVKRIVQYLKGTPTDGIIMKPNNDLTVDCYVDADFAGLLIRNRRLAESYLCKVSHRLCFTSCRMSVNVGVQVTVGNSFIDYGVRIYRPVASNERFDSGQETITVNLRLCAPGSK